MSISKSVKKLLSSLFSLILIFSMFSGIIPAYADNEEEEVPENTESAVIQSESEEAEDASEEAATTVEEVPDPLNWEQYTIEELLALKDELELAILNAKVKAAVAKSNLEVQFTDAEIIVYAGKTAAAEYSIEPAEKTEEGTPESLDAVPEEASAEEAEAQPAAEAVPEENTENDNKEVSDEAAEPQDTEEETVPEDGANTEKGKTDIASSEEAVSQENGNADESAETPQDGTEEEVPTLTWKSLDPSIATVNAEGVVTGISEGQTYVSCESEDGSLFGFVPVTVRISVTELLLSDEEAKLLITEKDASAASLQLTVTVLPENAFCKDLVWSSDDESIVTVDENGIVKGIKAGNATITAISKDESVEPAVTASCEITVLQAVSGIELSSSELTLNVGDKTQLTATITPEDATDKGVEWKSSDENIATVDSKGQIKALATGSATITCSALDGSGISTDCKINVIKMVSSVKINEKAVTVNVGKARLLAVAISPEDASNKELTWTSTDETIAKVDSKGRIEAIASGTATITCTTTDGSNKSSSITVTIKEPPVYYSTNDKETAKNGNSGVFAYSRELTEYTCYHIIDFDKGYVYYFTDGYGGDSSCYKGKIISGDLNTHIVVRWDDGGGTKWTESFCFKWVNQPEKLIWNDSDGYSYEYRATDLDDALKIRDTKKMIG